MDDNLEKMVAVAELDFQIFELKKRINAIPKRLRDARKQLDAEAAILNDTETPWNELEEDVRQKESTITVALDTIGKFEAHMKLVKTQKEFMAAKKQVDDARKLNDMLQEEILQARVKQEAMAPALAEIRSRHANVKESYEATEKEILVEQKSAESEISGNETEMRGLAENLSGSLMTRYKRLAESGKLPAIVRVEGGNCTGCSMAILPQNFNRLIAEPGEFQICSSCQRIVYYVPPVPEVDPAADTDTAEGSIDADSVVENEVPTPTESAAAASSESSTASA